LPKCKKPRNRLEKHFAVQWFSHKDPAVIGSCETTIIDIAATRHQYHRHFRFPASDRLLQLEPVHRAHADIRDYAVTRGEVSTREKSRRRPVGTGQITYGLKKLTQPLKNPLIVIHNCKGMDRLRYHSSVSMSGVRNRYAEFGGDPHQVGQGVGMHLAHHVASMDLEGDLAYSKLGGTLFVH
jgi:hypothetical protein